MPLKPARCIQLAAAQQQAGSGSMPCTLLLRAASRLAHKLKKAQLCRQAALWDTEESCVWIAAWCYGCLNNWALLHFPDLLDPETCPLGRTDLQSLAVSALCSVKSTACCIASMLQLLVTFNRSDNALCATGTTVRSRYLARACDRPPPPRPPYHPCSLLLPALRPGAYSTLYRMCSAQLLT